mmetsp:Transcript_4488/g.12563  ORF Transcript_4488/g.12563 Transcript_4488/m.12563 type:complete len:235 (-) Transcript_4488:339-1043(-)
MTTMSFLPMEKWMISPIREVKPFVLALGGVSQLETSHRDDHWQIWRLVCQSLLQGLDAGPLRPGPLLVARGGFRTTGQIAKVWWVRTTSQIQRSSVTHERNFCRCAPFRRMKDCRNCSRRLTVWLFFRKLRKILFVGTPSTVRRYGKASENAVQRLARLSLNHLPVPGYPNLLLKSEDGMLQAAVGGSVVLHSLHPTRPLDERVTMLRIRTNCGMTQVAPLGPPRILAHLGLYQ